MRHFSLEEEYHRNPNLRREDINYLKEWLTKQPHLPNIPEEMLVMFLHSCDYKLEATKHTIECHYTLKTHVTELWSNRDPLLPELQRALQVVQMTALSRRDRDGNLVLMCRVRDLEPSHLIITDATKVYVMFHDLAVQLAGLVTGVVIVIDEKGTTLAHVSRFSPTLLKKHLAYLQDGFPAKIVDIHIINCVPVTEAFLTLARPFLKNELLNKLKVHDTGLKSFHRYVPQEILPKEYGGNAGSFDNLHTKTIEDLTQHRDWFLEEEKLRVDESKRLGPDRYITQEFGIVGSFRKLEID